MVEIVSTFLFGSVPAILRPHIALFLSVVVGIAITFLWSEALHGLVRLQYPENRRRPDRTRWIAISIGVLERLALTIVAIRLPEAVGPLAGTWIVAKSAGGWGTFKQQDLHGRSRYYATLMGSILSVTWAIGWGIWAQPRG